MIAYTLSFPGAAAATPAETLASRLAGKTVFLDPGHQGSADGQDLARQVDDGRGGTKECQTTGMTSVNGVGEHTINWNVTQLVKRSLELLGARVVLSRNDDAGWGGCIDERARAANSSGADVAVSIHADSAPAGNRGFHLIIPALPIPDPAANDAQSGAGLALSQTIRDSYTRAGFSPANYAGVVDGLQTRADIAGPALTTVPLAFVEMGNGGDPEDARTLETGDGQLKHAVAITTGIVGYLLGGDAAAPVSEVLPGVADARGVRPGSPATPAAPSTESPSTDSTTPRSSTPPATTPDTETSPSVPLLTEGDQDGLIAVVVQVLQPLLDELGLSGSSSLADEEMFGLVSDLASAIVDAVMQSGVLEGN
ncbi:MAG TPA: N-acetylmuramoyl-L-alanine amidase [Aldersonia sp.]